MMQQAPQPKQNTPGRRRQGRSHNTPQKTYASENDVPSYKYDQSGSPCTPQKSASSLQAQSTNQKQQRNRQNKSRNKNGSSSPGVNKMDRQSPSAIVPCPAAAPAFAGATFHASPAPSALPMPSFLINSSLDSPGVKANSTPGQEPSPPESDDEPGSDPSPPSVPRNEESPLEFFFKAQREEKARTRRASSANAAAVAPGPFSPPRDYASPQECNTFPRTSGLAQPRRSNGAEHSPGSGISAVELDGTPGQPLGPAFSTPYQERIRAARSQNNSGQSTPTAFQPQGIDRSEDLKRYLFSGKFNASQQPEQPQARMAEPANQPLPRGMFPATVLSGPSHGHQMAPQPSYPAPNSNQRSEQILAMEDGLRRMLKLN